MHSSYDDQIAHAAALQARIAELEAENEHLERAIDTQTAAFAAQRDAMISDIDSSTRSISELLDLLLRGAGEDSPEYRLALELVGAPPVGEVSAPDGEVKE